MVIILGGSMGQFLEDVPEIPVRLDAVCLGRLCRVADYAEADHLVLMPKQIAGDSLGIVGMFMG